MRSIRYDQQFIEDSAWSVLRMETQLDTSLYSLNQQIDRLDCMLSAGSSTPLLTATEELRRLKKLIWEKEEDLARLRSALARVMDVFEQTELKLKRDFGEPAGAKAIGAESDAEVYIADQTSYDDVNALVGSLFVAIQSIEVPSSNNVAANAAAFEWRSTDFIGCGVTALESVKRVTVAPIAPRLNTVGSSYDVIAPDWMI